MAQPGEEVAPGLGRSGRWGKDAVDPRSPNLPALKANFMIGHTPTMGDVLEIGCGEGKMLRTLAHHLPDVRLFGCDVREPQSAEGFTFACLESEKLPYPSARFDAVLVMDVLEHVPDPRALLGEAARVLKPSGRFVGFIPVEGEKLSFYELWRRALGPSIYAETKEHIQAFTHDELRRMIEERFEITELEYAYHALGQLMDASFFAATRIPALKSFWWKDNAYYNKKPEKKGAVTGALNGLLKLGNGLAWAESKVLARSRLGAAGVLVCARRHIRSDG
jgi:SAM-dependent methyltransferase